MANNGKVIKGHPLIWRYDKVAESIKYAEVCKKLNDERETNPLLAKRDEPKKVSKFIFDDNDQIILNPDWRFE